MRMIEILAPAGSKESLIAAINASADAVYIGGNKFGARAYANNFTIDELKIAIDYVHLFERKIYLTINTLLKDKEIEEELYNYLYEVYIQGIDAVIVQDIGVLNWVQINFPQLPIHASTQMTITDIGGVKLLEECGVSRVVLARELSLEEIRYIKDNSNIQIEAFVHGALCYSYSGQCLFSSMIGGRSGNRGRCAQPCRMAYSFFCGSKPLSNVKEPYLLSPKDLCTIEILPELVKAGIDSFKIEGRMKKPEYVAGVVAIYRKYLEYYNNYGDIGYKKYLNKHKAELEDDYKDLMDLYNRGGFTRGYYQSHNGKKMISLTKPNHAGIRVGHIEKVENKRVGIRLESNVNAKDVLEIQNGDKTYDFTIKEAVEKERLLTINTGNFKGAKYNLPVVRTRNTMLINRLKERFNILKVWNDEQFKDIFKYHTLEMKHNISAEIYLHENERLKLSVYYKEMTISIEQETVFKAVNQPISKEKIITQLLKTGNTVFTFSKIDVDMDENIFVSIKDINELRRMTLEKLEEEIINKYRREPIKRKLSDKEATDKETTDKKTIKREDIKVTVHLENIDHIKIITEFEEVKNIHLEYYPSYLNKLDNYINLIHNKNKKIYIALPYILRKKYSDNLQNEIKSYLFYGDNSKGNHDYYCKVDGFVIRNIQEYTLIQDIKSEFINCAPFEIILDHTIYIMNQETKRFWKHKGINNFTVPMELNEKELKSYNLEESDFIVYGKIPIMISAQCLVNTTKGCTRDGGNENYYLQDRFNKKFVVKNYCDYCYNVIYNSEPLWLCQNAKEIKALNPKNIRLDFITEDEVMVRRIIEDFIKAFRRELIKDFTKDHISKESFTRGHFKRGVE